VRVPSPVIDQLRQRIERLEAPRRRRDALSFGLDPIDRVLPDGGLAFGALHEVAGGGNGAVNGAAAALFTAGGAARTRGKVLWCLTRPDLFVPAVAQAGLSSSRVIYVECGDDKTVLGCFEEGLRHNGLGAVIAEVARLSMTASRLQHGCNSRRNAPARSASRSGGDDVRPRPPISDSRRRR
jgi:protein ImuA